MNTKCFDRSDQDNPKLGPGDEIGEPCEDCNALTVYGFDDDHGLTTPDCPEAEGFECHICQWTHATAACNDCGTGICREHGYDGLCINCKEKEIL